MSEIMLKCENVSKRYRLGVIGGTTLREDLQRLGAKIMGKEDPTRVVGSGEVTKGEFYALSDVSFEVKRGEAVGIIGHNGAGKSTLLKLITRVTGPTDGTISLNGRVASMLEVGTGFHPELTGRENIYMNGAILGMTRSEIDAKLEEIIEFSEVRQFIDTPVKRYSSGMYVKLAFSVAAHLNSEIVIMDEVLAVGDMAFQKKCLTKMREAAKVENRTVLYVSHNMNTIRQLCDRVIVLEKGRVIFDGDVDEGIAIYAGNNENTLSKMDFTEWKRPDFLTRSDIRLMRAEYVGKDVATFDRRDGLKLRLTWKNNKDVEDLGFRFVVYGSDDTHLCATFMYDVYSGKAGRTVSMDINVDVSTLAPGNYQSYYVFFTKNEYGGTEDIDWIHGLNFAIDSSKENGRLPWRSQAWGHFELPSPALEGISEAEE